MRSQLVQLLGEYPSLQVALRRHWHAVEEWVGMPLPDDYKWFVEEYGDAILGGHLFVPHPATEGIDESRRRNLLTFMRRTRYMLDQNREFYMDISSSVEENWNTLVPWAYHNWDGDYCVLVPPAQQGGIWRVAVAYRQWPSIEMYDVGIIEFMTNYLVHGLCPKGWPTNRPAWTSMEDTEEHH